jgi:dipeptide/tripeptide permease
MTWAWLLITAGVGITVGFVYYWLGVDRTEKRFAADFDATLEAYAAVKRERDQIAAYASDLVSSVGVLSPVERAVFNQITKRLERLS